MVIPSALFQGLHVVLLFLTLFLAGVLVIRFVAPMMGADSPKWMLKPRTLIILSVVTVAGFVVDQWLLGRFR